LEHARIVSQLHDILEISTKVENTPQIDLAIRNNTGRVTHVFEVKTSCDTQSVYSAIGQLFFHALSFSTEPQKIFVAPENISIKLRNALNKLKISIVTYTLNKGSYCFKGLEEIGLGCNKI
jgi:hypothetical protein